MDAATNVCTKNPMSCSTNPVRLVGKPHRPRAVEVHLRGTFLQDAQEQFLLVGEVLVQQGFRVAGAAAIAFVVGVGQALLAHDVAAAVRIRSRAGLDTLSSAGTSTSLELVRTHSP